MKPGDFDVDAQEFERMVYSINPLIGPGDRLTMNAVAMVLNRLAAFHDSNGGVFAEEREDRIADSYILRTLASALEFDAVKAIDMLDKVVTVHPQPAEQRAD